MSKATQKRDKNASFASTLQNPDLHQLLRAIMAVSASCNEFDLPPQIYEDGEQILLDIDFAGARYLLIKMPLADRKCLPLSPRELEIVRMVAQGHQNKVIAVVLNISSWTVCTHLRRIFAKLGVSSRAAMVARVTEFGGIGSPKISLEQPVLGPGLNSIEAAPRRTSPTITGWAANPPDGGRIPTGFNGRALRAKRPRAVAS